VPEPSRSTDVVLVTRYVAGKNTATAAATGAGVGDEDAGTEADFIGADELASSTAAVELVDTDGGVAGTDAFTAAGVCPRVHDTTSVNTATADATRGTTHARSRPRPRKSTAAGLTSQPRKGPPQHHDRPLTTGPSDTHTTHGRDYALARFAARVSWRPSKSAVVLDGPLVGALSKKYLTATGSVSPAVDRILRSSVSEPVCQILQLTVRVVGEERRQVFEQAEVVDLAEPQRSPGFPVENAGR